MHPVFVSSHEAAVPIWFVTAATYGEVRERLDPAARAYADAAGFDAKAGRCLLLPGAGAPASGLSGVLFGVDGTVDGKARVPHPSGFARQS